MPAKTTSKPRRQSAEQFGHRYPITVTADGRTLVIRKALQFLPPDVATAVRDWLHTHGLDENEIPIGRPITRLAGQVTYWARPRQVIEATVQRAKAPAGSARGTWPAPFPQVLLDQPTPDTCPTCGHPATTPEGA